MNVYEIKEENVGSVAKLMSGIKPDWWDYEGAAQQLSDVGILAKLTGWYLGEDEVKPRGWVLCAEFWGYSCLSIECLGFDDGGKFVMEDKLEKLILRAEEYAKEKGLRNLKYVIGSTEMSCHGRPLENYAEELKNLRSCGREHFDYFRKLGFVPAGFIPNCYGVNYHGIIMIKTLV